MIRKILFYTILLLIFACQYSQKIKDEIIICTYTGWWIYGDGQHIFKDENTLQEWGLVFPNENKKKLVKLYLAITEMEYFPLECTMMGILNDNTLTISDFEITYIHGCVD